MKRYSGGRRAAGSKDLGRGFFGPSARRRPGGEVTRKGRSMPTSILLTKELIGKLRAKAALRGIGYQTMLKIIVHEHLDEY